MTSQCHPKPSDGLNGDGRVPDATACLPAATMVRHVEMGDLDTVRLYFVSGFRWMAAAFENLLRQLGHPLESLLDQGQVMPVVHAECDYARSPSLGDRFEVVTQVARVGRSSVTTVHSFVDWHGEFGRGRTVHVWVDGPGGRPVGAPDWLRRIDAR